MPNITISLDEELLELLEKRAEKNFLSTKEQIEDIIRRSSISYKKRSSKSLPGKIDDKLIHIFSRDRRGRKRTKKK